MKKIVKEFYEKRFYKMSNVNFVFFLILISQHQDLQVGGQGLFGLPTLAPLGSAGKGGGGLPSLTNGLGKATGIESLDALAPDKTLALFFVED